MSENKTVGTILEDLDWLNNTGIDQLIAQGVAHLVDLIEYKNKHNRQQLDTVTHQYGNYYVHLQHVSLDDDTEIPLDTAAPV